jgi:hypothetical protein
MIVGAFALPTLDLANLGTADRNIALQPHRDLPSEFAITDPSTVLQILYQTSEFHHLTSLRLL